MERIVTSVKDHIKNLISWRPDERVQQALEGTCFYPFTQLQHDFKHSLPLIQALVNAYEPEDNVFTIGGHRIIFSLEDVLFITGLPVDAEPVTGVDGHHADVCREFLGKYEELQENNNSERDGMIKMSILRDKFAVLPDGNLEKEDLMPYVRAYVLYIIGSVILPDKTGNYVPYMYLRLLRDIEDFNRYAWGAALLCHLHISLNNFFKTDSKCLAGSTFSLMIFAIERVPRLGLYLMGKEHPDGQELQDFLESRPNEFPLLQGWMDRLYPYSRKSHAPRDASSVANILANLQPGDICWRPYSRLDADFLPRHLNGQQHMGFAHTILLCFEKAVYHRPELCPGQFPAESVRRPHTRDLVIGSYRRGDYTDWSCHRKMRKYNDVWQDMRKYIIASPPIPAASNTEEPENEQVGKELTRFDGSSEPPSIAVAPAAYLQQPITNLQQAQLLAQILVHGSLMQNSVPEEACMIAAFGQSDDGVCLWEPAWRACSESIHSRQSHFSNMETPTRSCLGNPTFSPAGSKGIPSPVVDPIMPLSPPLWSLSSPTDGLRSGGRLPFAPLDIGGIVEDSPSWLSQTPLWHLQTSVPRQWVASQQSSSIDSPSCLLQTPLWHLQTPAPRQLVASPPTSSIGVSRPRADVAAAVGHVSPEQGHRASDTARTIYTVPESFRGTNSEAVASDNAQKPASGTTFKNEMVEGCLVEVFKGGGTCKAAWYLAEILNLKDEKAFVCYTELKTNEGSGKLKEWVPLYGDGSKAPTVRIAHPTTSMGSDGTRKRQRAALMDYTWSVGDRVDARMQDCERRQIKNMKSKREEEKIEDENEGKRQKLLHPSTASPPQPAFDNALLPLATYNDDDDDDEEEEEDQTCLDTIVDNPLQNEENGLEHQEGEENGIEHLEGEENGIEHLEGEEEGDEDDERQHNRLIELRRMVRKMVLNIWKARKMVLNIWKARKMVLNIWKARKRGMKMMRGNIID